MRFSYTRRRTTQPVFSLGNLSYRFVPILEVQVVGPDPQLLFVKAILDSGAVDTVFPAWVAARVGIDLTDAPIQEARAVGGTRILYRSAEVELRLTDTNEMLVWTATVGFGETIQQALLGHAGVMQFLDVEFLGLAKQITIEPNASFPGRRQSRLTR